MRDAKAANPEAEPSWRDNDGRYDAKRNITEECGVVAR
jgi:hypothetical protein